MRPNPNTGFRVHMQFPESTAGMDTDFWHNTAADAEAWAIRRLAPLGLSWRIEQGKPRHGAVYPMSFAR